MTLNDDIINNLLANNFLIDFIQIELIQLTHDNPIIFAGPGTIYQDNEGLLHLKMFHSFVDFPKEACPQFGEVTLGKILGDEHYFSLRAIDMKGNTWTSKKIEVPSGLSFPAAGRVIETKIVELVNEEMRREGEQKKNSHIFMVTSGKYSIPCNEKEEFKNGGWSLNTTKFEINGVNFKIKSKDNSLIINVSGPNENIDLNTGPLLLEALNIIFGKIVRPICIAFTHEESRVVTINSTPKKFQNSSLSEPIKHHSPWEVAPFSEFIEKYMNIIGDPYSNIFGYWHKINRAWQAGIENSALAITIAIEGVTKNYFKEYGLPDAEFIEQANDAKNKIKKLEIGGRIKERLLSSVGQSKSSNPKSSLYNLSSIGYFPVKLVDDWVALRNMSAHSDTLDEAAIQLYIDNVYSCLSLFYRLLFLHIRYENSFIDFTTENWPEAKLLLGALSEPVAESVAEPMVETIKVTQGVEAEELTKELPIEESTQQSK